MEYAIIIISVGMEIITYGYFIYLICHEKNINHINRILFFFQFRLRTRAQFCSKAKFNNE